MSFTPIKDRIEYGGALIGQEEKDAINRVIDSQGGRRWTIGEESIAFEKELAKEANVDHAIVVNSGSSALLVALTAIKLPRGSKVIIPACNFPTAFNAIIQNNLFPVVVDVDIKTLNISLDKVAKAIELHPDIAAVIAVDIAGNPVDLTKLRTIVGNRIIILDDCDGFGTKLHEKAIESFADISAVSFHAAHIITTGEGGAVLTSNKEFGDRARKIREWGRASATDKIYAYPGFPNDYKERYVYEEIGYNLKPLELQCAMGRVQLKRIGDFRDARMKNHIALQSRFASLSKFEVITSGVYSAMPCWFSFPVLCKDIDRKTVMETFEQNNIETRTIFSGNILKHPAYKDVSYEQVGDLTNSDRIMRDGFFLSVHPSITDEMINFIGKVAKSL